MTRASGSKPARFGYGLRERLLLSFIAISGFAVIAAVVGNYAFYAIGEALHQVTDKSVPPAIATLELAQRTERIVAAGPALLNVTTVEELRTASSALEQEFMEAERIISQLPHQGVSVAELDKILDVFIRVTANLESLKSAVQTRIAATDRKSWLLRDTFDVYNQFHNIWTPKFNELKEQILALQRVLDAAQSSPEERLATINRLITAIRDLTPLEQIQQQAAIAFEALVRAASAGTPADLDSTRAQAEAAVRRIDDVVFDVSFALIVSRLRSNAVGSASIVAARQVELEAVQEGRRLTAENWVLSTQLNNAVAALVAASQRSIATATEQTRSVQELGRFGLAVVVVLSLIGSALIGWLYVGRNIVARLTALSDRMLTLAKGDLKSPLPQGGTDEIGRMAEALSVFRATAIEMEETNLREIREARTRLTEAIETISEGFSLYDAEDKLIVCNSRYRELFTSHADVMVPGTTFETILRTATERGLITDAEGRREAWLAERLARHRAPSETHVQHRSDGRWVQVSERKTANGGVVAIYADITEIKRREAELAAARDAADEANRTKSSFLANMSHELRTPLNAILGYTELILDSVYGEAPDKMREVLDRIQRNSRHLLGLINDVLDLSKIEAGQLNLSLADYSLKDMVQSVCSAVEALAKEKGIALRVEVPAQLPAARGDERKLTQVLLNLVGNAIKFTDVGEVAIKAVAANGSFTVAVRDTGPGIAEAEQAKIFEEFQQADSSITKKKGGTGLGLAIAKRIIELHGGQLWVESRPGHGSTFSFTVPTKVEQQARPS
jgi:adenylate cyclase